MEFYTRLNSELDLRVQIPTEIRNRIISEFLDELRDQVELAATRYAPGQPWFKTDLRDRVGQGIDPTRLGRGGIRSFVDKVAYRLWDEAVRGGAIGLTPASRVTPPPRTVEMPAVG